MQVSQADLDLGNYERFLDITLGKDNNITTRKIYQVRVSREHLGGALGWRLKRLNAEHVVWLDLFCPMGDPHPRIQTLSPKRFEP